MVLPPTPLPNRVGSHALCVTLGMFLAEHRAMLGFSAFWALVFTPEGF